MITNIKLIIWVVLSFIPLFYSIEKEKHFIWIIWALSSILWIIPIFTGINVKNNEGQYKGYVVAVEKNGAIFSGWNAFLKTELESSNEDVACINRDDMELIEKLKYAQKNKENIVVEYEGVWQYKIGECPKSSWKIIKIN